MKKILFYLLCVTLLLSMGACGRPADTQKPPVHDVASTLDTSEEVTLYFVGHYENFEALETVIADFNQVYPNCTVIYEKLDDYMGDGLAMRLASNEHVDMFMDGSSKNEIVAGSMEELSGIGMDFTQIQSIPLEACITEEGLMSLPAAMTVYGMMVNEDLLSANGCKIPTTYEELCQVCDTLIAAGYTTPIQGYNRTMFFDMLISDLFVSIAHGEDPQKVYDDLQACGASVETYLTPYFQKVQDMAERGYINLSVNEKMADEYEAVLLRFMEGDVPFMIASGNTFSGSPKREKKSEHFQASPFTYSFVPVPLSSEGSRVFYGVYTGFSVNKNSENVEWANEFMRFLCNVEELNRFAAVKRVCSVSTSPDDSKFKGFEEVSDDMSYVAGSYELPFQVLNSMAAASRDMITNGLDMDATFEAFYDYMKQ